MTISLAQYRGVEATLPRNCGFDCGVENSDCAGHLDPPRPGAESSHMTFGLALTLHILIDFQVGRIFREAQLSRLMPNAAYSRVVRDGQVPLPVDTGHQVGSLLVCPLSLRIYCEPRISHDM